MNYKVILDNHLNLPLTFEDFLFNREEHLRLQSCPDKYTFNLVHKQENKIYARITVFIHEGRGLSPYRAPFGAIEFNNYVKTEEMALLLKSLDDFAVSHKLSSILIKSYPVCYAPAEADFLTYQLMLNGYKIIYTDLNYHLLLEDEFEEKLRQSELRRIRIANKQGLQFRELLSFDYECIYEFIKASRINKGYPMSMDLAGFKQMFISFPDKYKIFGVFLEEKMIATGITIEVNKTILYNFYAADDYQYKNLSPTVLLNKGMFEYGKRAGYKIVDIGIGTDKGKPNYGLLEFKKNLGGIPSLKLTFEKKFN